MDQHVNDLLTQGIGALRAGDPVNARRLLMEVTYLAPTQQDAWLWLSDTTTDPHEQRAYIERAIAIDPQSRAGQIAAKKLARLDSQFSQFAPPPMSSYGQPAPDPAFNAVPQNSGPPMSSYGQPAPDPAFTAVPQAGVPPMSSYGQPAPDPAVYGPPQNSGPPTSSYGPQHPFGPPPAPYQPPALPSGYPQPQFAMPAAPQFMPQPQAQPYPLAVQQAGYPLPPQAAVAPQYQPVPPHAVPQAGYAPLPAAQPPLSDPAQPHHPATLTLEAAVRQYRFRMTRAAWLTLGIAMLLLLVSLGGAFWLGTFVGREPESQVVTTADELLVRLQAEGLELTNVQPVAEADYLGGAILCAAGSRRVDLPSFGAAARIFVCPSRAEAEQIAAQWRTAAASMQQGRPRLYTRDNVLLQIDAAVPIATAAYWAAVLADAQAASVAPIAPPPANNVPPAYPPASGNSNPLQQYPNPIGQAGAYPAPPAPEPPQDEPPQAPAPEPPQDKPRQDELGIPANGLPPLPEAGPTLVFDGSGTLETGLFTLPAPVSRLQIQHDGRERFIVRRLTPIDPIGIGLVDHDGVYSGSVLQLRRDDPEEQEYFYTVEADGNWRLVLEAVPETSPPGDIVVGSGDFVSDFFIPDPERGRDFRIRHNKDESPFQLYIHCANGKDETLVLQAEGAVDTIIPIELGEPRCLWEVFAAPDGEWSLERLP